MLTGIATYSDTEQRALSAYTKLMRAAESVTGRTSRILSSSNLTVSQFGILEVLFHKGSFCQCELAAKILKSTGNITMVIDNLEKRNLVRRERDHDDRRFIAIHLTESGRLLIEDVFPSVMAAIVKEMSILEESEQDELARLCRLIGLQEKKELEC
ncbi:MAG: MarR family transcriptional regulator [Chlorobiaceae bacterium]|nr:MarR family transcriptional regulator [Chlorobiaceae bacterium]